MTQALSTLPDGATPAQAALAARRAAQAVLTAVTAAVLAARAAAAKVAVEQVTTEAIQASEVWALPITVPALPSQRDVDQASADVAGATFAGAFLAVALASVVAGKPKAISSAVTAVHFRLVRIVATEVSRAHVLAHRSLVRELARANPTAPWSRARRRWDARLDRVVCSVCRMHESEETAIDRSFRLGHEPGDVHPNCRCISTLLVSPQAVNAVVPAPYLEAS